MKKLFKKIFSKKIIWIPSLLALILIFYFIFRLFFESSSIQYISKVVSRGSLINSVSGTGQVLSLRSIEVKSKVSGEAVGIFVKNGQLVKTGDLLIQLDSREAQKTVRDAEVNLENAEISFAKLTQPASALSIMEAENSLLAAKESVSQAEDGLKKTYDDAFNGLSNAYLDLPAVMSGLEKILFDKDFNPNQSNIDYYADAARVYETQADLYKKSASDYYEKARRQYDLEFSKYKSINRFSEYSEIESSLNNTYETIKSISDAIKNANNLIQFYKDKSGENNATASNLANSAINSLGSYTGKTNTHLTALLAVKNSLESYLQKIDSGKRDISAKEESLSQLKAGADILDIKSQQLSLKQKQNVLFDAKEKLADYYVRAPFSGIVSGLTILKGDSVSSGVTITSISTNEKIAQISLNEVDASKIKIGQKVSLIMDALENLSLSGQVFDIDPIGSISQGVVSYGIKISFDIENESIKPGMSIKASIIIESKSDVLLVPMSAVKSDSSGDYVEILKNGIVEKKNIKIGISDDASVEIIEGLSEGDEIIIGKVVSGLNSNSANNQQRTVGNNPGGMNMMRIMR